jgi:hypothetical protein
MCTIGFIFRYSHSHFLSFLLSFSVFSPSDGQQNPSSEETTKGFCRGAVALAAFAAPSRTPKIVFACPNSRSLSPGLPTRHPRLGMERNTP